MKIVFMGTPDIAIPGLSALWDRHDIAAVITRADKPKGRGKALSSPPVKLWALQRGIPCYQPANLKGDAIAECIEGIQPDCIVLIAYGRILPPRILSIPRHGCINLHTSLLPKYRGAAPIQWAIINGETQTGVTIMRMDEGVDTGDIFSQRTLPITDSTTAGELESALGRAGAYLLAETLDGIERGTAVAIPQTGASCTAPLLTRDMERIDWRRTARQILRMCNAFIPAPCCYGILNGKKIKVCRAEAAEDASGLPGVIIKADTALHVSTGSGALIVHEVQPEGKRRMSASDFIRGRGAAVGDGFELTYV